MGAEYNRITVNGKRMYEHRYVLEQKLGRPLAPGEEGHHINENKRDNRPENLEVKTRREHNAHHLHRLNTGHYAIVTELTCEECGKKFSIPRTTANKYGRAGRRKTCGKACRNAYVARKNAPMLRAQAKRASDIRWGRAA
jgi:hypothetical protein